MSHYTCVVFGDNVDEQLQPFKEGTVDYRMTPIGDIAEKISNKNMKDLGDKELIKYMRHVVGGKESILVLHPDQVNPEFLKDLGNTFVEGERVADLVIAFDDKGKTHVVHKQSFENWKWDWYEVGGRWGGMLLAKPGVWFTPHIEESAFLEKMNRWPGVYKDFKPVFENGCDSLLKREIDLAKMQDKAAEEYMPLFDKYSVFREGYLTWDQVKQKLIGDKDENALAVSETGVTLNYDNIRIIREHFWNQPAIKNAKDSGFDGFVDKSTIDEYFLLTREQYEERVRNRAFLPYSFLKDGRWYSRGDMGWFGMSSNDKEHSEWSELFMNSFNSASDDTRITVVDCHT